MQLLKLASKVTRMVARNEREALDLKNISAAVRVLDENPAYKQAVEETLRTIVEQWLGSKPDARDERERLYHQAHALSQLDGQLSSFIAMNAMKDKRNAG